MTHAFFNPSIAENFMTKRAALRGKQTGVMLALPRHYVETKPEYLDQLLDYAPEGAIDWIQIHHGNIYELSEFGKYPKLQREINRKALALLESVIAKCHPRGIKVAWMPGAWTPPAGLFEAYPDMQNLQTGAFWQFVYDTLSETLERVPGLDELSTYLFEAPGILHVHDFFKAFNYGHNPVTDWVNDWPYLSFADHIRLMLQAMARACKDHGRSCSLLTHTWYPYQEDIVIDALREFPEDLPLILEHNYSTGDFNPWMPAPRMVKALPQMQHSLLFCGGLEYNGVAEIPCPYPELMQEHLLHAMEQTPNYVRTTLRPVWAGNCVLGTPNEINLEALFRLAEDPLLDTDDVWRDWAAKRYGDAVAAEMADLLRGLYEPNKHAFFTFGIRSNNHSELPDFDYLQSRFINYGKALAVWVPTPETQQAVYEMVVRPTEKSIRRSNEEHAHALRDIEAAQAKLTALQGRLAQQDYAQLAKMLEDFADWIRLHQAQMEAYLRYRIQVEQPSEQNKAACLALTDKVVADVQTIFQRRPDATYLLAPEALRRFAASIKERLQ